MFSLNMWRKVACIALLGSGALGCERKASPPVAAVIAESSIPLNEMDCQAFGQAFEDAVLKNDANQLNQIMDWQAFGEIINADLDVPDDIRKGFVHGISNSFSQQLASINKEGGTFKLLRVRERDGKWSAIMRLKFPNGQGLNYHEILLFRDSAGHVRGKDIYIYLSGETFSATARPLLASVAASAKSGWVGNLTGSKAAFVKNIESFASMKDADGPQALAIYEKLPADMKQMRGVQLLRLMAAQKVDDATYLQVLTDIRTRFPDEAGFDLVAIDMFILQENFAESLACVERLDKAIGGDPYLENLRAILLSESGKPTEAKAAADRLVAAFPDDQDARFTAITVAMKADDNPEILRQLQALHSELHVPLLDLKEVPEYAGFVKSPQHEEWLQYLETHPLEPASETTEAAPDSE